MKKWRIFLAEDQTILRDGLKLLINGQPDMEVVGEAASGREAVARVKDLDPHIVIMDISMPDMNGIQATEEIKRTQPQVKVLALTVHETKSYVRQLLKIGASGYIVKRSAAEELVHGIRAIGSGGVYLDPVAARKLASAKPPKSTHSSEAIEPLSQREEQVLRLLAWGHSTKETASHLRLSPKTVETYKNRLAEKLSLQSRVDIVRYALNRGWLQPGTE